MYQLRALVPKKQRCSPIKAWQCKADSRRVLTYPVRTIWCLPNANSRVPNSSAFFSSTSTPPESSENSLEECRLLAAELAQHDHCYHTLGAPTVPDSEYDALRNKFQALLINHPDLADSELAADVSDRVGSTVLPLLSPDEHYHHTQQRMLSLENTFDVEGVQGFVDKLANSSVSSSAITVMVEPKVDGVSLSLRYEDGRLVKAGRH